MNVIEILRQKGLKKLQAREMLVQILSEEGFSFEDCRNELETLKDKQIATFLEAVEAVSGQKGKKLDIAYLDFAKKYILSENNSCKREASRIVGNMAAAYPDALDDAIPSLMINTKNDGTVVRWGSAYALSRIVVLDRYSHSELAEQVKAVCEAEEENGVKNQYVKALKQIRQAERRRITGR